MTVGNRHRSVSPIWRMWKLNIKRQSNEHNQALQMTFSIWSGYSECVGYLPCGTMLIGLNCCLDLIFINFNWSTPPWSIVQWEISSGFLQIIFDMFDQSEHLLHTQSFFLLCFSCIFTFLEIIKHNMPKMFLLSSIITKFTNFDNYFKKINAEGLPWLSNG